MKNFFKKASSLQKTQSIAENYVNNEIINMFQASLSLAGLKTRSEATGASTKIAFDPQLFLDS